MIDLLGGKCLIEVRRPSEAFLVQERSGFESEVSLYLVGGCIPAILDWGLLQKSKKGGKNTGDSYCSIVLRKSRGGRIGVETAFRSPRTIEQRGPAGKT